MIKSSHKLGIKLGNIATFSSSLITTSSTTNRLISVFKWLTYFPKVYNFFWKKNLIWHRSSSTCHTILWQAIFEETLNRTNSSSARWRLAFAILSCFVSSSSFHRNKFLLFALNIMWHSSFANTACFFYFYSSNSVPLNLRISSLVKLPAIMNRLLIFICLSSNRRCQDNEGKNLSPPWTTTAPHRAVTQLVLESWCWASHGIKVVAAWFGHFVFPWITAKLAMECQLSWTSLWRVSVLSIVWERTGAWGVFSEWLCDRSMSQVAHICVKQVSLIKLWSLSLSNFPSLVFLCFFWCSFFFWILGRHINHMEIHANFFVMLEYFLLVLIYLDFWVGWAANSVIASSDSS